MKRFITSVIAITLFTCTSFASDPASARVARKVKPRLMERQTGVRDDDFPAFMLLTDRPLHERLVELIVFPGAPILRYISERRAMHRMNQLLNESEDLAQAR
jgi:hypothetical protein